MSSMLLLQPRNSVFACKKHKHFSGNAEVLRATVKALKCISYSHLIFLASPSPLSGSLYNGMTNIIILYYTK